MTRFTDGPAADTALALRRTPLFLRVVRDRKGRWDALDQPADMPGMDEAVHVYLLSSERPGAFLCSRGGRGGFFPDATYRHYEAPPSDETARGVRSWQEWCVAEANRLGLKGPSGTPAAPPDVKGRARGSDA